MKWDNVEEDGGGDDCAHEHGDRGRMIEYDVFVFVFFFVVAEFCP